MTIDINELREAIQTFGSQAINEGDLNELLDRLEAAEKGHDELHTAVCREGDRADAYQVGVFVLRGRLEAAEKERDELRTELKEVRREVAMTHYTINTLQAKIEAMEQQEPVASVWRCDNGHIHGSCERTLPMGAKLYALPGAKGE